MLVDEGSDSSLDVQFRITMRTAQDGSDSKRSTIHECVNVDSAAHESKMENIDEYFSETDSDDDPEQ